MSALDGLSKGSAWEYRLHRALFASGWYIRRNVDLRERLAGSPQTMAEIDLLGLSFDPSLAVSRLVGECKDRKGATKEADRVIWLMGLGRLLKAGSLVFAKTQIAASTIKFAESTDVALLDAARVNEIEDRFDDLWVGMFDPQLMRDVIGPSLRREAFGDTRLREAYDWIHNASWYEDPFPRVKRLHNYMRLVERYGRDTTRTVMLVEGLMGLLACAVEAAGRMRRYSPQVGRALSEEALGAGAAPAAVLRDIAARADDYYVDVLQRVFEALDIPRPPVEVPRLANHIAEPPAWSGAFFSFADRVTEQPHRAADLLRWAELELFERHVAGRDPARAQAVYLTAVPSSFHAALALAGAFCQRAWGLEDRLFDDLRAGNGGDQPLPGESGPLDGIDQRQQSLIDSPAEDG